MHLLRFEKTETVFYKYILLKKIQILIIRYFITQKHTCTKFYPLLLYHKIYLYTYILNKKLNKYSW